MLPINTDTPHDHRLNHLCMKHLAIIAVVLLCAVSLDSQISPGALHRLIGNPSSTDDPTTWANLKAWYGPDSMFDLTLTNPAAIDSPVGRWKDKSANNHDLYSINTLSRHGTNRLGGANSSNYLAFSPTPAAFRSGPYTNDLTITGDYTVAGLVLIPNLGANNATRPFFNDGTGFASMLSYDYTGAIVVAGVTGAVITSTNIWNNYTSVGKSNLAGNTTNILCYINSTFYTNSTGSFAQFVGFELGNQSGSGGCGYYEEILVYDGVLTANQITTVYNYLKTKYGL